MASFWRKYKLKNGSVVNTQDPIAKNWIDAFNKIDYSKSGKQKSTSTSIESNDNQAIEVFKSFTQNSSNTVKVVNKEGNDQDYKYPNISKDINTVSVDKAGAATRAYNKVLGNSGDSITPGTTKAANYTLYGIQNYIDNSHIIVSDSSNVTQIDDLNI